MSVQGPAHTHTHTHTHAPAENTQLGAHTHSHTHSLKFELTCKHHDNTYFLTVTSTFTQDNVVKH